jgi:hypothetical protein
LSELLSVHVLVIHVLVVEANLNNPPRLAGWAWGAVALFLAGTALWVAALWRRFGGRKALEDKRQVAAQGARE